jgi:pimeloyl-ACP methyl ester carboxylesterase
MTDTRWLQRPEGRLAYDVDGEGPLVVCLPGMGDLRQTFRHVVPALRAAGYRVATLDLRGHGDSDASFSAYDVPAAADDARALIETLGGGPAVVIGNSMGASAAALLAAQRPALVSGLVLAGPFLRDGSTPAWKRAMFRLVMAKPWAVAAWKAWLPKLYAGKRPADHDDYLERLFTSFAKPGHKQAFARTTGSSHAQTEAHLGDVRAPALVVMGALDPDFPDPAAEAAWAAEAVRGEVLLVPEAGHYPLAQQPETVTSALLRFLEAAQHRA